MPETERLISKSSTQPGKKIRFEMKSNSYFHSDEKLEELSSTIEESPFVNDKKKENVPSLFKFLRTELTRGYFLENDEEHFVERREKVYSFMRIPREVEKFTLYGFLQCADSFLFVYTYLPIRFLIAVWNIICYQFKKCFRLQSSIRNKLKPAEICDVLKGIIIIICSLSMFYLDTNFIYHIIRSQSVIKLYIFFNMLEVGDKLFSAFGQDIIDALFWTATERRSDSKEHFGVFTHFLIAIVYVFSHAVLILFQVITLCVAINSNNKSLLTIMLSNNFVEIKGSVFKKFNKNNLFQVSCSDTRERFHLFILLFIVILQTMKEYSWNEDRFWILLPDCLFVLGAEMIVDWIKHAFITRFNDLEITVYREYTISLAYDMAQTRQKNAFSDHSDLVSRRMGFIPLPLCIIMIRMLVYSIQIEGLASYILLFIGYLCLLSIRVLNSIIILATACYLIDHHRQKNTTSPTNDVKKESSSLREIATSPIKINFNKELDNDLPISSSPLGVTAIFSNSSVNLKDVCLNEEILNDNVEGTIDVLKNNISSQVVVNENLGLKRAESEPSILFEEEPL